MRLILLIAVIALAVDAFFYSGAYTQAVVRQVVSTAEQIQNRVGDGSAPTDAKPAEPERQGTGNNL